MRAYYYTPQDVGMDEFPPGQMQLAGFTAVPLPHSADVFVLPAMMYHVGVNRIRSLPYLKGNEHRHVMFNVADWYRQRVGIPAIMFRCDATKWIVEGDPTTVPFGWPVDPLGEWINQPFENDVVFYGWISTDLQRRMNDSVRETSLSFDVKEHDFFYGYCDKEEQDALREPFLRSMARARLSLCARSIPHGVVRYRFYEAMSMGRIPVHICDGRALPFSDRIDYEVCSIHIPESDVDRTGEIVADWLESHSDEEIRERGQYGMEMWQRWLNRDRWSSIWGKVVKEKLG